MSDKHPIKNIEYIEKFDENYILAEANFLKHPTALLTKKNRKSTLKNEIDTGESSISYTTEENGAVFSWEVLASAKYGYPAHFDLKVRMAIQKLLSEEMWPPPVVWELGSCARLCRAMGGSTKGKFLKDVKRSLERWSATSFKSNHFWLKDSNEYLENDSEAGAIFHIWDIVWKGQTFSNGKKADSIYIIFSLPFIMSLQSYYVKPIDYNYWLTLRPTASRLYEITGLKFYGLKDSKYCRFNYVDLCNQIPTTPYKTISEAQRSLRPHHEQLAKDGWISKVTWVVKGDSSKIRPYTDWQIRYYPGPKAMRMRLETKKRFDAFNRKQDSENNYAESAVELSRIRLQVQEIEQATNDIHSTGAFWSIVRELPEDVVYQLTSEIKLDIREGRVEAKTINGKNPAGALLIHRAKEFAANHQIPLFEKATKQRLKQQMSERT